MTSRPGLREAMDDGDVTLALTSTQLVLTALGLYIVLRFIRSLRRSAH